MAKISPYFDIRKDSKGQEYMEVYLGGFALLRLVLSNKGTAFTSDEQGLIYPPIKELQQVSIRVAYRVIKCALSEGLVGKTDFAGQDLDAYIRSRFWHAAYLPFVKGV